MAERRRALDAVEMQSEARVKDFAERESKLREIEAKLAADTNQVKKDMARVDNERLLLDAEKSGLEADSKNLADMVAQFDQKRQAFQEQMKKLLSV